MTAHAELDALILAYLADTINGEDLAQLDEMLRADDGARKRFAELAAQEIDLHDVVVGLAGQQAEERPPARGRLLWFRLAAPLAAAASIALLVGLWALSPAGRRPDQPVAVAPTATWTARIRSISGAVTVTRGAQTLAAAADLALQAGDKVRTGKGAAAAVGYEGENTRLELGAEAELAVGAASPAGGKVVNLAAGTLSLSVAQQPAGRPMIVATPHARATVVGTEFDVRALKASTEIEVREGAVDMQSVRGGAESRLTAGRVAAVEGSTGTILVMGETLLVEEFDQGLANWRVHSTDKDGWVKPATPAMSNAVSVVTTTRNGKPVNCLMVDGTSVPEARMSVQRLQSFEGNAVAVDIEYLALNAGRGSQITVGMVIMAETWRRDKVLFSQVPPLSLNRWYTFRSEYRVSMNADREWVVDSSNYYEGRYVYAQQKVYPPGAPLVFRVNVETENAKLAVDRIVVRRLVEKIEPKRAE